MGMMKMTLEMVRRIGVLTIASSLFLCGCARRPEELLKKYGNDNYEVDKDTGALKANYDEADKVGYQFYTTRGIPITVHSNPNYHWYVPESYLNMAITAAPVECLTPDDIIITIGFADKDTSDLVGDNVYKILYNNMLDSFIKDLGRGDAIRETLVDSLNMYTVEKSKIKGHEIIHSIADYTYFNPKAISYELPCLQTSIDVGGSEKVVIFVQASTSTGLWDRTVLPTPFELELGQYFDAADLKLLGDVGSQCSRYYDKLEKYMEEAISLVTVGEPEDDLKIVSLNYTNNYGIDVKQFDKFCFLRLSDGSIYLLYEKNSMHAVEFITGSKMHRLSTDWTQFKKEVTDGYDGAVYEFQWDAGDKQ